MGVNDIMEDENKLKVSSTVEDGVLMVSEPDAVLITENEARELTESIKSTATAICILLKKAHDEKAWKAMGYKSWTEYIDTEFDFTRVRSYQLIAQGDVIKSISEASDADLYLTEKEAKIIKKELPKITKKITDETSDLEDEEDRKAVAQDIIDGEIQHALHNDKDTYDESKDIDAMIEEDSGVSELGEGNGGGYSNQANHEHVSFENTEEYYDDEDESDNSFYYGYMMKMIDIIEEFPSPDKMANEFRNLSEEEKIKVRNKMKYTSSWLNNMANKI